MEKPFQNVAKNAKHKREVCRYWLNSMCMKGDACEFLHLLDVDKMPRCPLAENCMSQNCNFNHKIVERDVCANYQLGFCSFGRRCAHLHIEKSFQELPRISQYWTRELDETEKAPINDGIYAGLTRSNITSNFRRKKCDYFAQNHWCPYFDMCNFIH